MSPSTEATLRNSILRTLACLAAVVFLTIGAFAAQGLSGVAITPVMFRQAAQVNKTMTLPIVVKNLNAKDLTVTIKISAVTYEPWSYAPHMGVKSAFDCSDWFTSKFFQQRVPAGRDHSFQLVCKVPKVESGVYYCLGSIDQTVEGETAAIAPQYEIPIILFVGSQRKLDLKFESPELFTSAKDAYINVPFVNDGDAFTVIGALVTIRNMITGQTSPPKADTDHNMYPQSKRKLHFSILPLADGQYRVSATCQAGSRVFRPITRDYLVKNGVASPIDDGKQISLPPFLVEPSRLSIKLQPGAKRSEAVTFTNTTDNPITIALSAHRLLQTKSAALQVLDDGPVPPLSVEVYPDTLTIQPKHYAKARAVVSLDKGSTGDSWFAISAVSTSGSSMSEEVYGDVQVPGTEQPKMVLVQKETGYVGDHVPISIDYEVSNTGNWALKPIASAAVMLNGLDFKAKLEVPLLGDGGILPGATLHNRLMLPPDLAPGTYSLDVSYQYGEDLFERARFPFTIPVQKKKPTTAKKPSGGKR